MKKLLLLFLIPLSIFANTYHLYDMYDNYANFASKYDVISASSFQSSHCDDGTVGNGKEYITEYIDGSDLVLVLHSGTNNYNTCKRFLSFSPSSCASGYAKSDDGKFCVDDVPKCAGDEHLDLVNNVCVKNCSIDQFYLSSTEQCVSSCPAGYYYNRSVFDCSPVNYDDNSSDNSCSRISNYTVSLSKYQCSGNFNNFDLGYKGVLLWQDCDNTCYVVESLPLSCETLLSYYKNSCDISKNNFSWSCTDALSNNVLPSFHHNCVSKNDGDNGDSNDGDPKKYCNDRKINFLSECKSPQVVTGSCIVSSDGSVIDSLKCEDPSSISDPCSSARANLQKVCSGTITGSCESDPVTGEIISNTLKCDGSSNDTNITFDDSNIITAINDQTTSMKESVNKAINELKDSSNKINNSIGNLDDTMKGVSDSINKASSLLGSKLDNINNNLSDNDGFIDDNKLNKVDEYSSKLDEFMTKVSSGFDTFKNDFSNLVNLTDKGFSSPSVSSGSEPVFRGNVFGKKIEFNLCSGFVNFYFVGYWLFSIAFILLGLKIFVYSFFINI